MSAKLCLQISEIFWRKTWWKYLRLKCERRTRGPIRGWSGKFLFGNLWAKKRSAHSEQWNIPPMTLHMSNIVVDIQRISRVLLLFRLMLFERAQLPYRVELMTVCRASIVEFNSLFEVKEKLTAGDGVAASVVKICRAFPIETGHVMRFETDVRQPAP